MGRFRKALPHLGGDFFLTDGGIETTLIFHEGLDLPDFAAFDVLKRPNGEDALRKYFRTYAELRLGLFAAISYNVTCRRTPRAPPDPIR
jgi:homocysteine S-methyltransferase